MALAQVPGMCEPAKWMEPEVLAPLGPRPGQKGPAQPEKGPVHGGTRVNQSITFAILRPPKLPVEPRSGTAIPLDSHSWRKQRATTQVRACGWRYE
jgi:hypothetical protein